MEQIALTSGKEKAQVQSVLLLTDGLANCGLMTTTQIIEQMNLMQTCGIGAVYKPNPTPSFGFANNFLPFPQSTATFQSPLLHQHQTLRQPQRREPPSRKRPQRKGQTLCAPPTKKQAKQRQHKTPVKSSIQSFGQAPTSTAQPGVASTTSFSGGEFFEVDTSDLRKVI